jgi:hypothetical protein
MPVLELFRVSPVRDFTCSCGWRFILCDHGVFGPMWDKGWRFRISRLMTIDEFADDYADCAYNAAMTNPKNQSVHVHPFTD